MGGTVFIYSSSPGMNQQFMTLFKALSELQKQDFGTKGFRDQLFSVFGLLHFQFGYEEDLMRDFEYPHLQKHRDAHRAFRRELQGLLGLRDLHHPGELPTEEEFLTRLKHHCWFDDNDLIQFINGMPQTQTIRMPHRKRSEEEEEAIRPDDA